MKFMCLFPIWKVKNHKSLAFKCPTADKPSLSWQHYNVNSHLSVFFFFLLSIRKMKNGLWLDPDSRKIQSNILPAL